MQKQCFAKWYEDEEGNFYRDETILQYGNSWNLLENIILLNPGSATPINDKPMNEYLRENYPYFTDDGDYYKFSIDPLMHSLIALFKKKYPKGGAIRIYNLFNLKNPNSGNALEIFAKIDKNKYMTTPIKTVDFHNAPVIIATGKNVHTHPKLEKQLKQFIAKVPIKSLYAIVRQDKSTFSIEKATPNTNGLVESYHPSYACRYGNTIKWR